ncbi:hypothetical protein ACMHYJ_01755 [Castellaniella hirudinis]|uniref:hypothetical protein n=1 Tax=Castellaniella hirudinis TaxID=1144617 RepID=UPI0039C134E1
MSNTGQSRFSSLARPVLKAGLGLALAALAACSVTGRGLSSSGLNQIVEGRTTIEQASIDLGAQPTDIWRQGDTTLARWAYLGSLAYNAVYVQQEVWLRFGPDGTFQRMENSINIPPMHRPRSAAQADADARARQAAAASSGVAPPPAAAAASATPAPAAVPVASSADPNLPASDGTITIPGNGPGAPGLNPAGGTQPLLPSGTKIVPGVTYPLSEKS